MDNNNRWVEEHLAKLGPEESWRPDAERGLARLEERQRTPVKSRGRKWLWAGAAVLASGAGLMAFPSPRAIAQRCVHACEGVFSNSPVDLTLAPDFTLKDTNGAQVRLSDYKGKVILLNFWATWCPPCRTEMPWFAEFQRTYKDRGFVVIGVTMDSVWPEMASVLADMKTINYPVVTGNDDIAKLYGIAALPTTLLIDCDGRVKISHTGIVEKSTYESEIVQLLEKGVSR